MKDSWFRWEREASIHLLFPTLEGSMGPLEEYVGFGFPTTILIFKEGVATWCLKEDEFYELGRNLRKTYLDPKKEKQLIKDTVQSLAKLQIVEDEIDQQNLSTVSKDELLALYQKLHQAFLPYYAIGAISTPLAFESEYYLKSHSGLVDEELNALTILEQDSYSQKADKYLLKSGNVLGFIKKYYWLDNNYSTSKILTKNEVEKRLATLQSTPNTKNKKLLLPQVKLDQEARRMVELLKHYSLYKDERKKNILIYLHFLEVILKEVAQRSGLTMDEVRNIFPWEVVEVLNGELKGSQIVKRKKYCVVVWKRGDQNPKIFVGTKGKVWEKKVFTKTLGKVKTIKGSTASVGKVRGRVRILLSAKDCPKLKKGEILVTFMTSPDFMVAMRKASAVVTNLGGVISHAAIISRELGIPCIVGTKNAVQILKTGDLVEVDADQGWVRILS